MVIKQNIPEFKEKPGLWLCSSPLPINELVEGSKRISTNKEFVLLLNYGRKTIERTLPAYVNAKIRMSEGIARSKGIQIEMLLLICGTMNIGKALKECGAKNPSKFLTFTTKDSLFRRFSKENSITKQKKLEMRLDPKITSNVAMTELLSE